MKFFHQNELRISKSAVLRLKQIAEESVVTSFTEQLKTFPLTDCSALARVEVIFHTLKVALSPWPWAKALVDTNGDLGCFHFKGRLCNG